MIDFSLLALAFSIGMVTFLNPCSYAMLPVFFAHLINNKNTSTSEKKIEKALEGVKYGLGVTFGFAAIFLGAGIIVSWIGSQIQPFISPILLIVGVLLSIIGVLWIFDIQVFSMSNNLHIEFPYSSLFLFGSAYALSSLACVFPVFLMLVSISFDADGYISTIIVFLSFTLGMGLLMVIFSISSLLSKNFIVERFKYVEKYFTKISGLIFIFAGIYLVYYWIINYLL